MTHQNDLIVNVYSEVFLPESIGSRLSFKLSFHNLEEEPKTDDGKSKADLLQITFTQTKKIPADVEEYIVNNLGTYELAEDADQNTKTLSFELKINDINSEAILRTFEDFFNKRLADAYAEVVLEKSGSLEDFFADLRAYSHVPILLQLLERSKLTARMHHPNGLLEGFGHYLKSEAKLELAGSLKLGQILQTLRGDLTLVSYKDGIEKDFKALNLDQRDLMKEFFLAFENPLVKYIFENGQKGHLHIRGRILNILNYEVLFEGKGTAEFLYKLRTTN